MIRIALYTFANTLGNAFTPMALSYFGAKKINDHLLTAVPNYYGYGGPSFLGLNSILVFYKYLFKPISI